jgi:heme A synthase
VRRHEPQRAANDHPQRTDPQRTDLGGVTMTGTLQTVHSNLGYLVFFVVLVAAILAARQSADRPAVSRLSLLTMILLDIHVTIGIVLYVAGGWWDAPLLKSVAHPLLALAALGVGHAALARARRQGGSARGVAKGLAGALLLVAAAIAVVSV